MKCDVLVVGSGSAGIAAAITCYEAGLNVAIVTKFKTNEASFLQPLESIHPGVISLLKSMELDGAIEYASKGTYKQIFVEGNCNPLGPKNFEWDGHHIDKLKYNTFLLSSVCNKKITIIEDEVVGLSNDPLKGTVKIKSKKGYTIDSDYIIDATGASRKIGRLLKLKEVFLSCPLYATTGISEYGKKAQFGSLITEFRPNLNGWTWIAPESDYRFTWTRLATDRKDVLCDPFPNAYLISKIYSSNVRWRLFRPICQYNILLCGDAAGILDPAAGQGILNALWSGIMAGNTIISCFQKPLTKNYLFAMYDQWFVTQFENKIFALSEYYTKVGINFQRIKGMPMYKATL